MLNGEKHEMFTLSIPSQESEPSAKVTVPFCVYSVTSCVVIKPFESVSPTKILVSLALVIFTVAPLNPDPDESSTLTSKNHFTVRLLELFTKTLLLLKLTFKNVTSVDLMIIS